MSIATLCTLKGDFVILHRDNFVSYISLLKLELCLTLYIEAEEACREQYWILEVSLDLCHDCVSNDALLSLISDANAKKFDTSVKVLKSNHSKLLLQFYLRRGSVWALIKDNLDALTLDDTHDRLFRSQIDSYNLRVSYRDSEGAKSLPIAAAIDCNELSVEWRWSVFYGK